MIRSLFFSIGLFAAMSGGVLFYVDRVTLRADAPTELAAWGRVGNRGDDGSADGGREIDPPDWLPYVLVTGGVLTAMYAVALPRR